MSRIYTVWVVFTCLLVIQNTIFCATVFKCGPEYKCTCEVNEEHQSKIDCSHTMLNLTDMCTHIGNATYLDSSSNNITLIDNKIAFKGCQNLTELILSNNSLTTIIDDTFSEMSKLNLLDLSLNNLDVYQRGNRTIFTELPSLKTLLLNRNLKVAVPSHGMAYPDLSGLTVLETLYIDGLINTDFGSNYAKLTHLTRVHLSGSVCTCNLGNLTQSSFENLKTVRILNISVCDIGNIEAETFQELNNLETLDLSQNQRLGFRMLRNVSYGLQFTNIQFLNYSKVYNTFGLGTELRKRDICYLRNTTLRELAINSNRLQVLETDSIQLFPKTLQKFHFNDNIFTFAPYLLQLACASNGIELYGSFQNMAHDPALYKSESDENQNDNEPDVDDCPYMRDDVLKNISDSIHNCHYFGSGKIINYPPPAFPKTLKKVMFNDCNMKYTINAFLVLPLDNTVEYLDFSGNILDTLIGKVGPLFRLKYLDVSRTYCSHISDKMFNLMPNLENLQLQKNFIGLIPEEDYNGIFGSLTKLKTLNLTLNRITSIPSDSFSNLINLETLDLSSNSLEEWKIDVANMANLTFINISFNFINSLPQQLMNHFSDMSTRRKIPFSIDMRNNTIKCTCQYKKFLKWMLLKQEHFVQFESYIFVDENGKPILPSDIKTYITKLSKNCKPYTLIIVLCSIGISVFLSIVIGGVIYKNRWKLRYFFYMSKNRHFGYSPIEYYKHDAFISYAEENIRFILDGIIPHLEEDGMSLCIHQRDFLAGNAIADNINDAIKSSRKTVVILTKAFVKRKWCLYEFNMARMESIYSRDGRSTLVIAMLEDIPAKDMPLEMLEWIQTESYIEYTTDIQGQEMFWDKLKDAIRQ